MLLSFTENQIKLFESLISHTAQAYDENACKKSLSKIQRAMGKEWLPQVAHLERRTLVNFVRDSHIFSVILVGKGKLLSFPVMLRL